MLSALTSIVRTTLLIRRALILSDRTSETATFAAHMAALAPGPQVIEAKTLGWQTSFLRNGGRKLLQHESGRHAHLGGRRLLNGGEWEEQKQ